MTVTLLTDHLRAMAAAFPDKVAYQVIDGGRMTFAEWEAESNRLARALVAMGVAKGDRVSIYLRAEEALRFMVAYSAVHKAGAVAVPTNTRLTDGELERLLGHAEVRVVLTDEELAPLARRLAGTLPTLQDVIVAPPTDAGAGPAWRWAVAGSDDDSSFQVEVSGEDLADILYTSGTTGLPKGVAIRHRNVALIPGSAQPQLLGTVLAARQPAVHLRRHRLHLQPDAAGALRRVPTEVRRRALARGRRRAAAPVRVPGAFDGTAHRVASPLRRGRAVVHRHLRHRLAPLAPATLRALQERMPEASVSNSYGMTEAGPAFCSMPKGESLKRIGSVGHPVPPLEVRIVDDDGRDLPSGEVGEAILRMKGREREYYRNDEATAGTWKDGWLYSGDLARLDEDGYLYIVGRKKDVIIRGGNNIHAVDVEAVLLEHPDVVEAAVVGIPHAVLGEDVAAVVVLAPGTSTTIDDLRELCAGALADYKVPRRIEVVDELPRNATGKVLKARLQDQLAASAPR